MIKTLRASDIVDTLMSFTDISNLVTLYSWTVEPKTTAYWLVNINITTPLSNTNLWFQIKEARVSITIISPKWEDIPNNLSLSEEDIIDNILDMISSKIVDEWKSKISTWTSTSQWDIISQYCNEETPTPLLLNVWDRAYKIKDFLIWYESHYND